MYTNQTPPPPPVDTTPQPPRRRRLLKWGAGAVVAAGIISGLNGDDEPVAAPAPAPVVTTTTTEAPTTTRLPTPDEVAAEEAAEAREVVDAPEPISEDLDVSAEYLMLQLLLRTSGVDHVADAWDAADAHEEVDRIGVDTCNNFSALTSDALRVQGALLFTESFANSASISDSDAGTTLAAVLQAYCAPQFQLLNSALGN